MTSLSIETQETNPGFYFDMANRTLFIQGIAKVEGLCTFQELFNWFGQLKVSTQKEQIKVVIDLIDYNVDASYCLFLFLGMVKTFRADHIISLKWLLDKDDEETMDLISAYNGVFEMEIMIEGRTLPQTA